MAERADKEWVAVLKLLPVPIYRPVLKFRVPKAKHLTSASADCRTRGPTSSNFCTYSCFCRASLSSHSTFWI
ncbi:unnamed protein product [Callosobruchus maculatus]|uniref:Uncharacterized protein n=1 Tax=Callosobruchus maculatus TaxID=64391 RepID=A0A653BI39_CALMS|nr:unnamed protein product [Callosobruchus maculatus]